jgi:hypothetical protein
MFKLVEEAVEQELMQGPQEGKVLVEVQVLLEGSLVQTVRLLQEVQEE